MQLIRDVPEISFQAEKCSGFYQMLKNVSVVSLSLTGNKSTMKKICCHDQERLNVRE